MAARYFHGTLDVEELTAQEQSRVLGALAVLEEMAAEGAITFKVGVNRPRSGERVSRRIQPQQARIIDLLRGDRWWSLREIVEETGINENSVSAQLSVLTARGVIEKARRQSENSFLGGRGRKFINIYRAAPKG